MTEFLQQIIYGINAGSIYALIALGYTMVYGIVKLINFAHGDILMMGAYIGLFAITSLNLPLGIAIILAMIGCSIFGMLIDKVAYKPLRNAPRISALITALGISLFLQSSFAVLFGLEVRKMPNIEWLDGEISLGSLRIPYVTILIVILSVVCMAGLQLIVRKTKVGKSMRAVSEDMSAAKLMGINVNRTISITFAIGSALGAVGGVLYSIAYYQISPYMGVMPGLKAFVAAVLGGIGIIPGAMFGGFLMGIIESLTKGFISSSWSNAIVFSILILVLLFKPSGILGKNIREKV